MSMLRSRNFRSRRPSSFEELGTALDDYPYPALGVHVTHDRTVPPGDAVMRPGPDGHRPNDPIALVPSARIVTLGSEVTHVGALSLVAAHLGAGDFETWSKEFEGLAP